MNHECRLWAALEQQQQQERAEAIRHQAQTPTPSSSSLSQTSRGSSRAPVRLRPAVGTKPMRTGRASGNKDRHSKVQTARGPRDRRVRLSVSTAIQFYDIQDRLGFDQPSKAIEWLLRMAKPAIDELYHSPAKAVDSVSKQEQDEEPEAEEESQEQPPAADMVQFESTKLESLDSSACLPAVGAVEQEQLKVEQAAACNTNLGISSRMLMSSQVSFTQLLQAPMSAELIPQFRSPQFLSQQSPSPPPTRLCFVPSEGNVQQQHQPQRQWQQESCHFHHQNQPRYHVAAEVAGPQKYYSAEIDQEQPQQVPRQSPTTSLSSLSASSSHHHLHLQQQQHPQQEHGWKPFDERDQAQPLLPPPAPSFSHRRIIPARIQGLEGIDEQLQQQHQR